MALGYCQVPGGTLILGGYSYPERTCLTNVSQVDSEGREHPLPQRMMLGRNFFGCVALDSKNVLAIGGFCEGADTLAETECLNLSRLTSESWAPLLHPVELASVVRIPNGLAVIGGLTSQDETQTWDCIQVLNFQTREWIFNRAAMRESRFGHASVELPSGRVLILGGKHVDRVPKDEGGTQAAYRAISSVEIWNPRTGHVFSGGNLLYERDRPGALVMPNGKVLVVGGQSNRGILRSIEAYDAETHRSKVIAQMSVGRMAASLLPVGERGLLIAGGWTDDPRAGRAIEYLDFRSMQTRVIGHAKYCRAENAMVWLKPDVFALIGGKDAFRGRNPHSYHFLVTERFRLDF